MVLPLYKDKTKQESKLKSYKLAKKIGLIGPFGYGNLGDAAIQQAMIDNIRRFEPKSVIYGFSINPKDTEARHGIPSYPICNLANLVDYQWWKDDNEQSLSSQLTNFLVKLERIPNQFLKKLGLILIPRILEILAWLRAYRRVAKLDILIVSGGGQLDDYWGGAWVHPFTLFMWGLLAKLSNTKFFIVSVGAAPIEDSLSKLFIKTTLSLADYRSYRDEDSKKYIEKVVGFKRDDPIYPDLAHSLLIESYQNKLVDKPEGKIIGVAPMSYFDPRVWPEKDNSVYLGYLTKLASFVIWLLDQEYQIVFFTGEAHHDQLVIADLRKILTEQGVIGGEGEIIEESILTVDALLNQIATTDITITSRFHGVLLSQLLNKPVLALSYHPKIDMLMADTGQVEYCLSIDKFNLEILKEKIIALESNRQKIKEQLAIKTQEYKVALEEQYEYLFRSI